MSVILCIVLISAVLFLFFALCAFALQAARSKLPTYEVPPTVYSYQMDHQTDDIGQYLVKDTPAGANPHQHIWVDVRDGRTQFGVENPGGQVRQPPEPR